MQRYGPDARKHLRLSSKHVHHVVIGRRLFARALKIQQLRPLARLRHGRVIVPVPRFILVHYQLSIGEELRPRLRIGQPCRVVRVHMRQDHLLDVGRIDPRRSKVLLQLTRRGEQIVTRARLDQRQPSGGIDRIAIHRRAPARAEIVRQHLHRVVRCDVLQHIDSAIEITVGQSSNDYIADAAVIHAGNLLRWNLDHARTSYQNSLILTHLSPCRHGRAEVPGLVPGLGPGHQRISAPLCRSD